MKRLLPFLSLLILSSISIAQNKDSIANRSYPWFVEKYKVSAGFFVPVNNTSIAVGIQGGANGTEVDFERDLGFNKNSATFMAAFQWRVSRRSRVNFNYYNINRSSSHTLNKDIIFKDDTFHSGSTTSSFFNTAIYQVSYGYALISKPKFEAGLMIGAHVVGLNTGIGINGPNGALTKNSDFRITAPLPDLGIWGGYAITDRFAVNLEGDYLSLTVNEYTGSILAYNVYFTYKILKELDVSLGYTGLNCKLDVVKEHANGHFKWGYNGPSLSASFSFGKFNKKEK